MEKQVRVTSPRWPRYGGWKGKCGGRYMRAMLGRCSKRKENLIRAQGKSYTSARGTAVRRGAALEGCRIAGAVFALCRCSRAVDAVVCSVFLEAVCVCALFYRRAGALCILPVDRNSRKCNETFRHVMSSKLWPCFVPGCTSGHKSCATKALLF